MGVSPNRVQIITDITGVEQDAHTVYQPLGFQPIPDPESWMVYTPPAK